MIITEDVRIKVNPSNLSNLGKYLPNVTSGEVIIIPVSYLTKSSHIKIDVSCDICGFEKNTAYRNYIRSFMNGGYYSCSQKCSKLKVINTSNIKYGVTNPAKSNIIKNKIKKSFQDKYGVDNISYLPNIVDKIKKSVKNTYEKNIDIIKEKQKNTNIERYGVADVNKEEWFKDKIRDRNIKKYGVDSASKLESTKNKIKKTNLDRYGVECVFESEMVKEKSKKTNLDRYGVEFVFKSEMIKEKSKKTNVLKYGVEYISQSPEIYINKILSGFRIKKHECGLNYQGTYEKDFIDFCIGNNISISKPPSFLYEFLGKNKRYYPDFFIENLNLIVEVKSTYYYNIHIEKNKKKEESIMGTKFKYLLILDKNYNEFSNIINRYKKI